MDILGEIALYLKALANSSVPVRPSKLHTCPVNCAAGPNPVEVSICNSDECEAGRSDPTTDPTTDCTLV